MQSQLLLAALNISTHILNEGGTFVAKIFVGSAYALLESQLQVFFSSVKCIKPASSRERSAEHFIVGQGYRRPADYTPALFSAITSADPSVLSGGCNSLVVPFLACGDLRGHDAGARRRSSGSGSGLALAAAASASAAAAAGAQEPPKSYARHFS